MPNFRAPHGRTLIELLVAQALMLILLLHASAHWRLPVAATQAQRLTQFLLQARVRSALLHEPLKVCPWRDNACCEHWDHADMACLDRHGQVVALMPVASAVSLSYRGFPHHHELSWGPEGLSHSNGTFVLCDTKSCWHVTLNQQGRTRLFQHATPSDAMLKP